MDTGVTALIAFLAVSSFTVMLLTLSGPGKNRMDRRLRSITNEDSLTGEMTPEADPMAEFARTAIPKMGAVLMPDKEAERSKLQTRLLHAGLYSRQAMVYFLGIKLLLMVGPALIGAVIGLLGLVPILVGIVCGALFGILGMIGPSFWLDMGKANRQVNFRRALPDALDVLVVCLEGGSSLPSAIQRVATDLRTAHPMLARELLIVQREVQMGRSTGEALRAFGVRCDLDEVQSLATVILQAERYGASLVKSLRVYAETFRSNRILQAEEMAQKAVVKLLFPTVLFILPALFVAVLGPTGIMIFEMFDKMAQ